jgi:PCI domain
MIAGQWNVAGLSALPPSKEGAAPISLEMVETYRKLARYHYDCGDYQAARDMLSNYLSLFAKAPPPASLAATSSSPAEDDEEAAALASTAAAPETQSADASSAQSNLSGKDLGNPALYYLKNVDEDLFQVLWGRLACEILVEDWVNATVAVEAVKTALEILAQNGTITPLEGLQQRTWLLHWSLFVYWNDRSAKGGLETLVELFHSERYKQAISTNAPHLLRYLTAAVLLCKRRITKKAAAAAAAAAAASGAEAGATTVTTVTTVRDNAETRRLIRNLVNVIQDCEYTDPIVEFVKCLCIKFDFDSAQLILPDCEKVLMTDFFLCRQTALFMEEARVFVFENYCRIHHKIDLITLSEKLAMSVDDTERWIVDLIRNADLDAKIDYHASTSEDGTSPGGCVIMGDNPQSIYEQVMDRTRDLNNRSATLSQNLKHLVNEARREKVRRERAAQAALEEE